MFPSSSLRLPWAKIPLFSQSAQAGDVLEIIVFVLFQILSELQSTNTDTT